MDRVCACVCMHRISDSRVFLLEQAGLQIVFAYLCDDHFSDTNICNLICICRNIIFLFIYIKMYANSYYAMLHVVVHSLIIQLI